MKKNMVMIVLAMALAGLGLHGQAIEIQSPAGNEAFSFGKILPIAWTSAGVTGPLSIKLRPADQPNAAPVLEIAANTENDGAFKWAIPASLASGRYQIRVRTVSDSPIIYGDSKAFTYAAPRITQNTPGNPQQPQGLLPGTATVATPDLAAIDFEMLDIERQTGSGVIFAKLRNNGGRAYNGPLTFLVLFGNDRLDPITVPVNLAAGATGLVNLMYYLSPMEMATRNSVLVKVVADSDTKLAEMNEQNNAVSRTITKTCPVYITSFQIEVTPSHSSGPYPLPVKLTLRLDVIGQGELEIRHVSVNSGSGTRKYQFPASGSYVFDVTQPSVMAAWLAPNPQKITCKYENAICPVIYAWVVGPCADGGQIRSNEVNCRYWQ